MQGRHDDGAIKIAPGAVQTVVTFLAASAAASLMDRDDITAAWSMWSELFGLPQLTEDETSEPASRRRRRNAVWARRPKFLVRRRAGDLLNPANIHRDEHEIIARN